MLAALVRGASGDIASPADRSVQEIVLDGEWEGGLGRTYDRILTVPGLATDPAHVTPGTLWYRKTIALPAGRWTNATLTLKGARFAPEVYVDGKKVSSAPGGMAATVHRFELPSASLSRSVTLEIALKSLSDLYPKDASATPQADLWRSNVSSCLWDSVILRLHGDVELSRLTPWPDVEQDKVNVRWQLVGNPQAGDTILFDVIDGQSNIVTTGKASSGEKLEGETPIDLRKAVLPWSPDRPNLYRIRSRIMRGDRVIDQTEQTFGIRDFAVQGLGFQLNRKPFHLRMGTVVWHRWTRDPEAKRIAFDTEWFERNIVQRLKELGANGLRFHLGLPPEKLLDLCDRYGLAVQMEWSFFHGISASRESMAEQWQAWLDMAMRHPSVMTIQAWNETDGEQLDRARAALDPLLKQYPPMVVNHRDVIPVHKYWWSLFENLGLYYDRASQFHRPVVADEFGGNYLDGQANPGGYPETTPAFLRFLGRGHSADDRLDLQSSSNARVAEYWRRTGVAGFSPFCILGSRQDGSHWFTGPTDVPRPILKPVWASLAAAFAPKSLSLELWNRNFAPGETITTPLWFFNETDESVELTARITIDAEPGATHGQPVQVTASVAAHTTTSQPVTLTLPRSPGEWRISATLEGLSPAPVTPIVSSWHVRTLTPQADAILQSAIVGLATDEVELRQMLGNLGVRLTTIDDVQATIIVGSMSTWSRLRDEPKTAGLMAAAQQRGVPIVLLDAGPQPLGVGYASADQLGGPLEGVPTVAKPRVLEEVTLFGGVRLSFRETAEPESTLQKPESNDAIWRGLPKQATWLWNGLRGGLIVPAADMQVNGIGGDAMLTIWQQRGADPQAMKRNPYYAYALADYYAYADKQDDSAVRDALRARVKFLVEDAPALKNVVNPNAPIVVTDLNALYHSADAGNAVKAVVPLANAGRNLSRTPVIELRFAPGRGSVIVSQLLTRGRLLPTEAEQGPGVYGLRYDPAAVQVVLNLMSEALSSMKP